MRALTTLWGRLHEAVHAQFPVQQGDAVVVKDAAGKDVHVDPTQADLYTDRFAKEAQSNAQ
jgi:hypothetical protein